MIDGSLDQAGNDPFRLAALACATAVLTALCGSPIVPMPQRRAPNAAPADYSDPAHWICRPGRPDACAANLDATIIAADGSMTREAFHADPDAPIDCFYVYPTVSHEPTGNADLRDRRRSDTHRRAAVRAFRRALPAFRSGLSADHRSQPGRRVFGEADAVEPRTRLWRCPRGLAILSRQRQSRPRFRAGRAQPGNRRSCPIGPRGNRRQADPEPDGVAC